jgi:hypothetical protein
VQQVILVEEQTRDLYPFDWQDLSVQLGEIYARVDGIEGECTTEARQLSHFVMEICNTLVDLGMLPIQNIA